MNRKMLAEMAVNDAEGFAKLAEVAKVLGIQLKLICLLT